MSYKCTRLKLNWQLEWRDERSNFIKDYLEEFPFEPNKNELEMMGKYILWGKNRESGLNGRQEGLQLETAAGVWDTSPVDSLDALLESPTFLETELRRPEDPVFKAPRVVFSREQARELASPSILRDLEKLWRKIDETELLVALSEIESGKRTTPPRASLLSRFGEMEIEKIHKRAQALGSYQLLREKHNLVNLRQQQYAYKDSYAPARFATARSKIQTEPSSFFWEEDVEVLPMGLKYSGNDLRQKIFRLDRFPEPNDFGEEELKELSRILWTPSACKAKFDFSESKNLSLLDGLYESARESLKEKETTVNSNFDELLDTYDSYVALTNLSEVQAELLRLKRKHLSNTEVSARIKEKFGCAYTTNYISTLYHQSTLGAIAKTAKKHREVCENLMFPENFKECRDCKRMLLRDADNFTRKAKVKDGFDCRCKECAKKLRTQRKAKYDSQIKKT